MLQQFKQDWQTAVQKREIIKREKNADGTVTLEQSVITFSFPLRNAKDFGGENINQYLTDARIFFTAKLVNGIMIYDAESEASGKKVPLKSSDGWPELAVGILTALIPGCEHEDRVAQRKANMIYAKNQRLINEKRNLLKDTSFLEDEQTLIENWLKTNTTKRSASWTEDILKTIHDFDYLINGRGMIEHGIDLHDDADQHPKRMYDTVAMLLKVVYVNEKGEEVLPKYSTENCFLKPLNAEKLGPRYFGIYTVRSFFAKVFLKYTIYGMSKFVHLLKLLSVYYNSVLGITLEQQFAEIDARAERKRNSKFGRKYDSKQHYQKRERVDAVGRYQHTDSVTIGDMIGNVLDEARNVVAKNTHAPVDSMDEEDFHKKPRKEARSFTNGHIKSKVNEEIQQAQHDEEPDDIDDAEFDSQEDVSSSSSDGFGTLGDAFDQAGL